MSYRRRDISAGRTARNHASDCLRAFWTDPACAGGRNDRMFCMASSSEYRRAISFKNASAFFGPTVLRNAVIAMRSVTPSGVTGDISSGSEALGMAIAPLAKPFQEVNRPNALTEQVLVRQPQIFAAHPQVGAG